MNRNKKAFTLVEMLFVVVIAAMVLTFSAYKIKNAKNKGVEQGAIGFLVDLANAKEAMTRDLAMQGVNLNQSLKSHSSANIQITGSTSSVGAMSLSEYLSNNSFSAAAFINALAGFGYMDLTIPSVSGYTYYVNIGYDIPSSCGTLGSIPSGVKVVAYMCKTDVRGWAYLSDGTIRELAVSE